MSQSTLENIDIHSIVAVYIQIENHVQFYKAGDQLPSVRELSERLGVNPNTVAKSYRDLEVMGLLYTRRGMGVYVNEGIQAKCRENCRKRIINRLHEIVCEAKAAGLNKKEVDTIVDRSMASTAPVYGQTPEDILALAKPASKKRKPKK